MNKNKMNCEKKKKSLKDWDITEYEVKEPFNKCLECKKECKTLGADGPDYFGETNGCDKCLDCAYKNVKKLDEYAEELEEYAKELGEIDYD